MLKKLRPVFTCTIAAAVISSHLSYSFEVDLVQNHSIWFWARGQCKVLRSVLKTEIQRKTYWLWQLTVKARGKLRQTDKPCACFESCASASFETRLVSIQLRLLCVYVCPSFYSAKQIWWLKHFCLFIHNSRNNKTETPHKRVSLSAYLYSALVVLIR